MTRVVEISADAVAGVRSDVCSVRDAVETDWVALRARARALGVRTHGFDDVLDVADRLSTHVLPVVDSHLDRARALEDLRYGSMGRPIPVLDVEPAPLALPFTQTPLDDGASVLTWAPTTPQDIETDEQEARESRGIGGWFSARWDDVTDAVDTGTDWVAARATDAWEAITDAGAAISDWWDRTTADLGAWVDEHLTDLRELIGRHVAVFRILADICRIVGWVVVVIGAILTIALAVIGAMGGGVLGAIFGLGAGAVPGGAAGALAGASVGLKFLGAGFALVSVGDFLDVAADWGEGKIDGQGLVQRGALELGLAITSIVGFGALGKIAQKAWKHLPDSWRRRIDDLLAPRASRPDAPPPPWKGPNGLHLTSAEREAVDELLAKAAHAEPRITSDLQHILSDVDGATMPGLEFRLKSADSLYRKVATELVDDFSDQRDLAGALADIKDAVRYTARIPDDNFAAGVAGVVDDLLQAGFTPVSWKNTFGQPGYQGINSTWRSVDGQVFELQFHTPTSFDVKMDGHDLYERARLPDVSPEEAAALREEMQRQFSTIPLPPGARSITPPEQR